MRIGVLGTFYDCEDLLSDVLEPWVTLKRGGTDIVLGGINVQFKEYADLGYQNNDSKTRGILEKYRSDFDVLMINDGVLSEKDARTTLSKELLEKGVDLIWILDGDEVYTKDQIKRVISFIEKTTFDYYHIYFDNRIFDNIVWNDNFPPPRIFRTNRHGGIKEFSWDNSVVFEDGTHAESLVPGMISKSIAHVLHYTWRKKNIREKIEYHQKHFGYCMYRLDENGMIDLDPAYFAHHKVPMPTKNLDGSFDASKKPVLDVVLRTHFTKNYRPDIVRVTDDLGGRHELILRCLYSLVRALLVFERHNEYVIRFSILDDHSDKSCIKDMQKILTLCPFETTIIDLPKNGNAESMKYALEYAKSRESDYIYFVEDDYLHESSTIVEMIRSHAKFSVNLQRANIGLFPVDYGDFYLPHNIVPTRVVPGSHRHWRVSYNTTSTYFIPRSLFDEHFEWFMKNPESEFTSPEGMTEKGSLSVVWQELATLFTPIPTLAYHMHTKEEMPPFSNWKKLWDSVAI